MKGAILPIVISMVLVVVVMLLLEIVVLQESNGKHKVTTLLAEKGFQQIKVKTKMFTVSRGIVTFEVEYLDRNGALQRNACMIHTSMFSVKQVAWETPLE